MIFIKVKRNMQCFLTVSMLLVFQSSAQNKTSNIVDKYLFPPDHSLPVQFILPEQPSSNIIQTRLRSWKLTVTPDGETVPAKKLSNIKLKEENGKWKILCRIKPESIPADRYLRIAFHDNSGFFEPCTSNQFATMKENLRELRIYTSVMFFLNYTRNTMFRLSDESINARFIIDGKLHHTGNKFSVAADPAFTTSFLTISIEADGYAPFKVRLQKEQIGYPQEIPVTLIPLKDALGFEKGAYCYVRGDLKNAMKIFNDIKKRQHRWGFLELYRALVMLKDGGAAVKQDALSIAQSCIERSRVENDFLLLAMAGLLKSQIHFSSGEYREAKDAAVFIADTAFHKEIELFDDSRMLPPLSSSEIKRYIDFYKLAAESELLLNFRIVPEDARQVLIDGWEEFRAQTSNILSDSRGLELMSVSPFEKRINVYVEKLSSR